MLGAAGLRSKTTCGMLLARLLPAATVSGFTVHQIARCDKLTDDIPADKWVVDMGLNGP